MFWRTLSMVNHLAAYVHRFMHTPQLYILKSAFINLMEFGLSPLGAAITRLPVGPEHPDKHAGASFEIFSDVQLLPQMSSAWPYFHERLTEIAEACGGLATDASTQA